MKVSSCYQRFIFGYKYSGNSEFYFSPFHYDSYLEAFNALEEFLRLCALDGDDVVFSSVLSFSVNVFVFNDID